MQAVSSHFAGVDLTINNTTHCELQVQTQDLVKGQWQQLLPKIIRAGESGRGMV